MKRINSNRKVQELFSQADQRSSPDTGRGLLQTCRANCIFRRHIFAPQLLTLA